MQLTKPLTLLLAAASTITANKHNCHGSTGCDGFDKILEKLQEGMHATLQAQPWAAGTPFRFGEHVACVRAGVVKAQFCVFWQGCKGKDITMTFAETLQYVDHLHDWAGCKSCGSWRNNREDCPKAELTVNYVFKNKWRGEGDFEAYV